MSIFIDWDAFVGNSSESEALIEFAQGKISMIQLERDCWCAHTKYQAKKLRRIGLKMARKRARTFCTKEGWDWK